MLKGYLMGMADIIPGVSGGTMALITGIYERLIHSIRDVDFMFIPLFFRGDREGAKKNFMSIDFPFLIPLGAGVGIAFLSLAHIMKVLLDDHTAPTYAFFFGLILASAGIVSKYVDRIDRRHILSGLTGFIFVFLLIGVDEIEGNHSPPVIFLSGVIAICAMILPGISGSLILLIIGQYDFMLEALNEKSIADLATFAAGAFFGLVLFSRVLDYMLRKHESMTMAFLFGLMLGALRVPVEKIGGNADTGSMMDMGLVLIVAILGFGMVILIETKSQDIEKKLHIEVESDDRDGQKDENMIGDQIQNGGEKE
jgi:putative membrane protein